MGSEQCVPSPPAPQVVTDPEDQTVTSGQSVALTAAATGSQNPTVQWLSGANGSHDYVHAGSTAVVQTTTGPRSPGCRSVRTRTPTPLRATSAPLTGLPRGQWRLRRRQERHRHAGIGADEHRFRRHHSLRHVDTAGSHLFHPRHHQLRGECRRRRCDGDIHDPGLTFRPERERACSRSRSRRAARRHRRTIQPPPATVSSWVCRSRRSTSSVVSDLSAVASGRKGARHDPARSPR